MNNIQATFSTSHVLPANFSNDEKNNPSEENVDDVAQKQFLEIENTNSQENRVQCPNKFVESVEKESKAAFDTVLADASKLACEMRECLQLTNAIFLEKVIEAEKKHVVEKLCKNIDAKDLAGDLKEAKERIEDAMDSLKEISLLDQIGYLSDHPEDASVIKDTLIERLHLQIKNTIKGLDDWKRLVNEVTNKTPHSVFHSQILEFISQKKDDLIIAKNLHRSKNHIQEKDTAFPVKDLNVSEVKSYVTQVTKILNDVENELEKMTSIRRIFPLLKNYSALDKELTSTIPLLIQGGNYLGAHLLTEVQKKHKEKVSILESTLSSSNRMKAYAETLEEAAEDIEKTVLKVHDEILKTSKNYNAFDELKNLSKLKSPYTKDLQDLILITVDGKIERYISTLSLYQDLTSLAIPAFEQQASNNIDALNAIVEKIDLKKRQAEEIRVSFVARQRFWNLEPVVIKVDELNVSQLENYVKAVDDMICQGIQELNEDATKAGFSWD